MKFSELYPGLVIAWSPKTISIVGNAFGKGDFELVELEEDKNGDSHIDNTAIDESDWNRNSLRQNGKPLSSSITVQTSEWMRHTIIDKIFDSRLFRNRR
jgi:hypothetical protein